MTLLAHNAIAARDLIRLYRGKRYLFRPRPDDVFVVSYPKSGTTLMQMMLYQLVTRGETDFPHLTIVSPWFEMDLMRGSPQSLEVPSPRILKSHLQYGMLLPKAGRFIYMLRDPRDVALSAYHHHLLMGEEPSLDRFMRDFVLRPGAFPSWCKHVASWWPHRNDPNVLFVRYEDVVADMEGTVGRVAAFCGIEVHEEDLPKILEHCGIDFMKGHQEKFDPRTRQTSVHRGQFIRQGKAGSGREVLIREHQEILAKELARLERRLGAPAQDPLSRVFQLRD